MGQIALVIFFIFTSSTSLANTFTHNPPRLIIASDLYPWRLFGKLISCPNCKTGCTAFLVSEDHIATNRHCVFDDKNNLSSKDFYFIRNPIGDDYTAEAFTATFVSDGYSTVKDHSANDWALLKLSSPIGKDVGYMGFKTDDKHSLDAHRGDRPEIPPFLSATPDPYAGLCAETEFPFTDFLNFSNSSPKDSKWFEHPLNIPHPPQLCMAGFPGDVGNFNLVLSQRCTFVGRNEEAYFHDCASTRGSSGSPIFYLDEQGLAITVSLNRGAYRPDDTSVVNAPINMNNSNISTENTALIKEIKKIRSTKQTQKIILSEKN